MKAYWLPAAALHGVWELLPHVEAPFLMPAWWERAPFPYGAIVMEDEKGPTALIPLALRRAGLLRLYRQPLSVPEMGIRLRTPLPDSPAEKYRLIAAILGAFAGWVRRQRFSFVGGTLAAEWSYLPPLRHLLVRGHGSFIVEPGQFSPSRDLLRKVRSVQALPLRQMPVGEAFQWWLRHQPAGISRKFAAHLAPVIALESAWEALGIGEPLLAVGIFLHGEKRTWYMAGAHLPESGQAGTRLLYEAILRAHSQGKVFDFHGSVLPGVERFFRQFGGRWETRYAIAAWRIW